MASCWHRVRASWLALICAVGPLAAGCANETPARPQVVLVVDTDSPTTAQASIDPELSGDAAVDTLRIDVLGADGRVEEYRELVVPDAADWPVSLGVAAGAALRLRAFRASLAISEYVDGSPVLRPRTEVAIDRTVDVEVPAEGVATLRVVMSLACIGRPPGFSGGGTTCVDGAHPSSSPRDGLEAIDDDSIESIAGSSPLAREVRCGSAGGSDERVCVPGGLTAMGEPRLGGTEDPPDRLGTLPLVPVWVSAFRMDLTEVTVGRYDAAVARGFVSPVPPFEHDPADPTLSKCTWRGGDPGSVDLPLNCVTWETARELCRFEGGDLPTEAQWEHAARGRGQRRFYPWGDDAPTCCAANLGHPDTCPGDGPEVVASHAPGSACAELADVSRDGAFDLGGNLSEMTRDRAESFGEGCWAPPGLRFDPACEPEDVSRFVTRGGYYGSGATVAASPMRSGQTSGTFQPTTSVGVRCVYVEARP